MKTVTRRTFAGGIALLPSLRLFPANAQAGVTPAEARAVAKEAYVSGFPLVDSYRIQYDYFVDTRVQGTMGSDCQHASRLHTSGHSNPDAQLGHALFLVGPRPAH